MDLSWSTKDYTTATRDAQESVVAKRWPRGAQNRRHLADTIARKAS